MAYFITLDVDVNSVATNTLNNRCFKQTALDPQAGSGSEAESALIVKLLREAGGKTYAELQVAEGLAEEADLPRNASDVMV